MVSLQLAGKEDMIMECPAEGSSTPAPLALQVGDGNSGASNDNNSSGYDRDLPNGGLVGVVVML